MEKKKKLIILGVILLLIIVSGATFAILTWNSTMIKLGINTNCFTIDYTRGGDITGSLKLLNINELFAPPLEGSDNLQFTIKKGMGLSYVNVGINSNCSIEGYGTIYLNVTELSDTFKDGGESFGALRYAILKNTSNLSNKDITIDNLDNQSFEMLAEDGVIETGKITLLQEELSNTEVNKYIVIIYIDDEMSGNDVTEATFKGNISVEAVQKNKKELTPDYCFNLVEKDDTNMTASIGGQKNPVNGNYVNAGYYCYEGNNYDYEVITDVVIPSIIDGYTIVGIKGYSFYHLGLTSIEIPSTVKYIGYTYENYGAFANNQLTSISLPASVTEIDAGAFMYNPLTNITVDPNNPVYDSRDNSNAIIKTSSNTLVQGSKNTIIPDTVNIIGRYAFSHFQLKSINIPDTVTTIGESAFSNNQLTSINIPDSVTEIGYYAFKYNNLNYVYIGSNSKLTSIGGVAFSSSNGTYTDIDTGNTYVDNPNLVIYNNSGKAFDWNKIVNGNTGTSFVTGTTNTRTSGSTTYNPVEIKTGNP